jgi:hypothetical protein
VPSTSSSNSTSAEQDLLDMSVDEIPIDDEDDNEAYVSDDTDDNDDSYESD